MFARNSGHGIAAAGSTRFVAGAAVGNAIGNGIKAQQDFNDCMAASGWTIADQTPERMAAQKQRADRIKGIVDARTACFVAVRADPMIAPIARHLPELETNKFSISQLADTSYPSREEGALVARYSDSANRCRDQEITALSTVAAPVTLQSIRDTAAGVDSITVLLVQQRLTWGEWASQVKQVTDDVAAKARMGK